MRQYSVTIALYKKDNGDSAMTTMTLTVWAKDSPSAGEQALAVGLHCHPSCHGLVTALMVSTCSGTDIP